MSEALLLEHGPAGSASPESTRDDPAVPALDELDLIRRMHEGDELPTMALARTLGARCVSIEPGLVVASLPHASRLENVAGLLHARASSALLDATMSAAALTLERADRQVVTLDLKITHLQPVRRDGMPVRAIGLVVNRGDLATYVVGELRDAHDRLVAHAVGNFRMQA